MAWKDTIHASILNAASRAKTNVSLTSWITFATVQVTDDDVSLCDGPGMPIDKTYLLIVCHTAFLCNNKGLQIQEN